MIFTFTYLPTSMPTNNELIDCYKCLNIFL